MRGVLACGVSSPRRGDCRRPTSVSVRPKTDGELLPRVREGGAATNRHRCELDARVTSASVTSRGATRPGQQEDASTKDQSTRNQRQHGDLRTGERKAAAATATATATVGCQVKVPCPRQRSARSLACRCHCVQSEMRRNRRSAVHRCRRVVPGDGEGDCPGGISRLLASSGTIDRERCHRVGEAARDVVREGTADRHELRIEFRTVNKSWRRRNSCRRRWVRGSCPRNATERTQQHCHRRHNGDDRRLGNLEQSWTPHHSVMVATIRSHCYGTVEQMHIRAARWNRLTSPEVVSLGGSTK